MAAEAQWCHSVLLDWAQTTTLEKYINKYESKWKKNETADKISIKIIIWFFLLQYV